MENKQSNLIYILMGVSGTGKSSIGTVVAQKLGWKFIDADDLHPRANICKMKKGTPLDDQDRQPWLIRINDVIFSMQNKNESGLIVCSALKKKYRDLLRKDNQPINFLYLDGSFDLVLQRMSLRQNHFMPIELLQSQFNILEKPENEEGVFTIDISPSFTQVVESILALIPFKPAR